MNSNFQAEFFKLGKSMCFRIPYKNGKGYLKSAIGIQDSNGKGTTLLELINNKDYIDIDKGEICDIDGYIAISIKSNYMYHVDKVKMVELELKEIIKQLFPHITGFFDGEV